MSLTSSRVWLVAVVVIVVSSCGLFDNSVTSFLIPEKRVMHHYDTNDLLQQQQRRPWSPAGRSGQHGQHGRRAFLYPESARSLRRLEAETRALQAGALLEAEERSDLERALGRALQGGGHVGLAGAAEKRNVISDVGDQFPVWRDEGDVIVPSDYWAPRDQNVYEYPPT